MERTHITEHLTGASPARDSSSHLSVRGAVDPQQTRGSLPRDGCEPEGNGRKSRRWKWEGAQLSPGGAPANSSLTWTVTQVCLRSDAEKLRNADGGGVGLRWQGIKGAAANVQACAAAWCHDAFSTLQLLPIVKLRISIEQREAWQS